MAIPLSASSTRELVPTGLHLAICYDMGELGTSDDTFQNETKQRRKVWLGFEVCSETRQDNDGKDYCLSIGSTYTASLGKKATLRAVLESWRNKPFTDEELARFDLKNVLGKPCMINVVHEAKTNGGGTKAVIKTINPMIKGMPVPAQVNPTRLLEFEDFDWTAFNALPEFLSKEIKRSDEFKAMEGPELVFQSQDDPTKALFGSEVEEEPLPF